MITEIKYIRKDIEDILNPPKTRPIQLINDDETLKEIELMAKVHCTEQEMQRILDVSEATWNQLATIQLATEYMPILTMIFKNHLKKIPKLTLMTKI